EDQKTTDSSPQQPDVDLPDGAVESPAAEEKPSEPAAPVPIEKPTQRKKLAARPKSMSFATSNPGNTATAPKPTMGSGTGASSAVTPRAAAAPAPMPDFSAATGNEPPDDAAPPTEPKSTEPQPAAAAPPKEKEYDYTIQKVFYGTDRKVTGGAAAHPLGKIPWDALTLAAGAVTLLLLVLAVVRRSKPLRVAMIVSLLATIGLGACMIRIPRDTKPEEADTSLAYGNGRGELELGVCEVSIPRAHQVGELESPSIFKLEFNEDPEKHVVLMKVERQEPDDFYDQLRRRMDESERREAFVFVHGYNVTFENAARRTAQLAHDLHFDGAPIFYSWPSQGGLLKYTVDETNVAWTVPHLRQFLFEVAKKTGSKRIHLIAHSMGNRALTAALAQLSTERNADGGPLFHEVLLTAPDIDADVFRRDIAPEIVKAAKHVTLYASSHDAALVASKKVHGYPRAGESGDNILVISNIDTIDVSDVDTSLVGHSYYGDSDTVLVDMAQLLHEEKPPDLRSRLRTKMLGAMRYWVFLAEKLGLQPNQPAP
ncbi:MAG TPA: alpha/beta hydrolase, partial [Thermoguttaceae bacterium]|nr:alpha/beta hydrolase [Thermoguttaceae bacterium]